MPSCVSVCLSVCLGVFLSVCVCMCVCVSVYMITKKNNDSIHLKLEHIVVYENSSDGFDIGRCPIKVKVLACLFSPFSTIQTDKSLISALAQIRKL